MPSEHHQDLASSAQRDHPGWQVRYVSDRGRAGRAPSTETTWRDASVVNTLLDGQFGRPRGAIGQQVGALMAAQHRPENAWTVASLGLAPADEVLEVGCGPGVAVAAVAQRVPGGRVAGVDLAPDMIAMARVRNASAVAAGRVTLVCADVAHLPFPNLRFDKALSIHSIYFWPDLAAGLAELHRVLKPGGLLALSILPRERWPANADGTWGTSACRVFSGSDLVAHLGTAGFAATRIVVDPDATRASNYTVLAIS